MPADAPRTPEEFVRRWHGYSADAPGPFTDEYDIALWNSAIEAAAAELDALYEDWSKRSYPPPEWVQRMAARVRALAAQPKGGEK